MTLSVTTNAWGALSSPYECVFKTTSTLTTNNQVTTGDVTWTLTTVTGKGSPTTTFGNTSSQSAIKLGSGKNNYFSKMTLNTSAFSAYNVSKVVLYISSNNGGSKTITVKQGDTQIGTGSQSFTTTTWVTNCTRNSTKGSGGDLSIEISSDATATFIHSITVTYEETSCSVKPTVGATLQSLSTTENSITATIPISSIGGCNITENGLVYSTTNSTPTVGGSGCTKVTTTACGSTAANKTVTITGLTCGQSYYIRGYATNEAGTSYTNVTIKSTSDCPKYTVTLMDDTDNPLSQTSAGGSVTLPERAGCIGYTFKGWTKSWKEEQEVWTTTAPTIIPIGSYTPTANESLYPVYTKTEGGGTSYQFQKVTALSQIKAGGTFIITNGSYYLPNAQASSSGPVKADMVAVTNGVVTGAVTDAMKWTFSAADANGKITIKSAANSNYYLYTTNSNGGLRVNNTSDTWTFEEYTVSKILGFAMKSTSNSRYCAVYTDGSDWRSYTTKNAANYETNSGRLDLYKYTEISSNTTYYISVPDCVTETAVTLNPNEGTGGTTEVTATYGQPMPAITIPTRTGYDFQGYFTATSGGTKYYNADGTSAKNWDKTSTATLYAQWECVTPTISTQPQSATYLRDDDADALSVVAAASDATLTYQWQKSTDNSTWFDITGATEANYGLSTQTVGTTYYRVVVTNSDGNCSATSNVATITVRSANCKWVETNIIEHGDEVVITSQIGGVVYALPNTYGTSTPNVVLVNNIKNNEIPLPSVLNDIKWTIEQQGEHYIFHPNGDLNSWLYCTNSNDGVRVGTNANNTFAIGQNLESITHVATSRSIRIGSTDLGGLVWRCYTTTSNQTLKFYKKECLDSETFWVDYNLANVTCTNTPPPFAN